MSNARWHDVCALEELIEGRRSGRTHRRAAARAVPGSRTGLRARQLRPGEPRQRVVARPDRQPAGRARGRVAYLQESLCADQRALHRRSDLQCHRVFDARDGWARIRRITRQPEAHAPGGGGQRHGRHAHRRGTAQARYRRPLLDHRVWRRAARQLQPHPAVAGALGRAAGRRHHAAPAQLVHAARNHAAFGRSHRRDRPQAAHGAFEERTGRAPTTACSSPPAPIPSCCRCPGRNCRAWSPSAISTTSTACWSVRAPGVAPWSSAADCWGSRRRTASPCAACT